MKNGTFVDQKLPLQSLAVSVVSVVGEVCVKLRVPDPSEVDPILWTKKALN